MTLQHGSPRQLAAVCDLNRRLFINCLDDVSDADAVRRPNELVNSIAFVACHVLDARHYMAGFLGFELANPLESLLGNVQSIEEVESLPALKDIRGYWSSVSTDVQACIEGLSLGDLSDPSPQRFPISDPSFGAALEFQLHHESYHIGQLALLRKFFGYPGMTYR